MAVIQIFIIISFTLMFFLGIWKIKEGPWYTFIGFQFYSNLVKTQKLTWNYLSICPDSWHNKKSLALLGKPANTQNNYIKLSGFTFRLDVTRFLDQGKFFNAENSFAVFYDQS